MEESGVGALSSSYSPWSLEFWASHRERFRQFLQKLRDISGIFTGLAVHGAILEDTGQADGRQKGFCNVFFAK